MKYKIKVEIHECVPNGRSLFTLVTEAFSETEAIEKYEQVRKLLGFDWPEAISLR